VALAVLRFGELSGSIKLSRELSNDLRLCVHMVAMLSIGCKTVNDYVDNI